MADLCRAIPLGTYRDQTLAAVEYLHPSACPRVCRGVVEPVDVGEWLAGRRPWDWSTPEGARRG